MLELINFCATDDVELKGLLYKARENNNKLILAIHGMTSDCFKKRDEVIAKHANEIGVDYFCFNNRGSEIVKYISKKNDNGVEKRLAGTAYEDVLDSYYDISGAIKKFIELGYTQILLQGHSLGCTKIVYTYNKLKEENDDMLNYVTGVILLSLVDIPSTLKVFLAGRYDECLALAESKEREGKELELMPKGSFIHPVCVKTFLRYIRDNSEIDFININKEPELTKLNNITVPIFMRWGNINELILEDAKVYSEKVNQLVNNPKKDIYYIEGADHGYHHKEEELAMQIINFIKS